MNRRFVFVCGCPRSGTTALARLLNAHPDVCLGIERYERLFRLGEATPALFEAERFADIRAGDTHYDSFDVRPGRLNQPAKAATASLVGDKLPELFRRYELVEQRFPDARIVFIVRDPVAVAASYARRLNDPADAWARTPADAIAVWNYGLRQTLRYRERLAIHVVTFHGLLEAGAGLDALAAFLGIDAGPLRAPLAEVVSRAARLREGRVALLTPDAIAQLRAAADMDSYIRLTGETLPVTGP